MDQLFKDLFKAVENMSHICNEINDKITTDENKDFNEQVHNMIDSIMVDCGYYKES